MTAFLVDTTLGKLLKWLRIMGFDVVLEVGTRDRNFLDRGVREGRFVLSRKKNLLRRDYRGTLLVIESDRVEEQIGEVLDRLGLQIIPEKVLSRCLSCNELLSQVPRQDAAGRVPPYVYETNQVFFSCPRCGSIFWPGTHRDKMIERLRKHSPNRLP